MIYYNNTLCISYGELVNKQVAPNIVGNDAFISHYDYLNYSKSKKLVVVRRACRGTEALYDFEKLPSTIREAVVKKHKDIVKTAQQEPLKKVLVNDYKAFSFFSNYTLPNGEHLKENTIREYTATATALNAVISLLNDSKAWRKALGGTGVASGSLKNLINVLSSLQQSWGWKLPNSERGLRGKITAYKADGYLSLISGKLCNENAAKATDDNESEAILRRLLAQFSNFDNTQISKLFNLTANVAGWKNLTPRVVGNYREKWRIYAEAGSRGKAHHENNHAMQVRRSAPTAPLTYWTVDGWDVELMY